MEFPERVVTLRKNRGLTQQALADKVGIHVLQIRRYEGGTSQPTLDVVRRLAVALSVSADELVFEKNERGPSDALRLQFEALSALPLDEQEVAKAVLDALIVKNQVAGTLERHSNARAPAAATKKPKQRARA